METLRLVMDGQACDWCRDRRDPITRDVWDTLLHRLDQRTTERQERDLARMEDRVCKACGDTFAVHPGSNARTCSKDCAKRAASIQRRATIAAHDDLEEREP